MDEKAQSFYDARAGSYDENLHLTIAFLGDQSEARLEDLHVELENRSLNGVPVEFDGLGAFGGGKPRLVFAAVTPHPALLSLRRTVLGCARRAGPHAWGPR